MQSAWHASRARNLTLCRHPRYKPAVPPSTPASHKHLHHWVFLIDDAVNDYEEDNAHYGDASIGRIHANLKASDIGLEDTPSAFTKIIPHVM